MKRILYTLTALLLLLLPSPGPAQDSLDPAFGNNGLLTTDFSIYDDKAYAVAVQADGKILVAGQSENGADTDIAVARYHSDGTLDTTFNSTGQTTVAVGSGDDRGLTIAVQSDGKILVAGTTDTNGDLDVAVIRLQSDGLPDMDFDSDGQLSIPIANSDDTAYRILVQEDGKIILAGSSVLSSGTDLLLTRLHPDGSLDTSFADNGFLTGTDAYEATAHGAILLANGNILLAGAKKESDYSRAALFSFLSTGQINNAYGTEGVVVAGPAEENSTFYDVAALSNEKVAATGAIQGDSYRSILLAGFTEQGDLDPDFNKGSIVTTDLGTDTIANSLAVAKDGSIYLAGAGSTDTDTDFILLHYTADGQAIANTPQTSASAEESQTITIKPLVVADSYTTEKAAAASTETNYTLTDFSEANDVANSLIVQDNGTILAVGTAETGASTDFALLSYTSDQLAFTRTANGITSWGLYIATTPPTLVTRNSAATGGYIKDNHAPITTSSTTDMSTDTEPTVTTTIVTESYTVTERGVCYGISPAPVWKDTTQTGWTTTTGATSTAGDGETATGVTNPFKTTQVLEGCTVDGDGLGEFRTDLTELTADTRYYLRAYAKLGSITATTTTITKNISGATTEMTQTEETSAPTTPTIIYGNELQFTTNDACFIATAAYSSPDKTQVRILRQFRDTYLQPSALGRKLIAIYYNTSPPLAEIIAARPSLQAITRFFLAPVTTISFLSLNPAMALQLALLITFTLILLSMYAKTAHHTPQTANPRPETQHLKPESSSGFTLIELLVVLVIIGILAGYVGPRIMGHPEEAKRTMATAQMSSLETALESYRLDNGAYPSTDQGLQALVEAPSSGKLPPKWRTGGYLKKGKVPKDPWGNDYIYLSPGSHSDFDIISYGADGESGGEDADADVNNWETE